MASPSHPPIIKQEEPFVPSKGWAEMIRKVYEVDPLLCPSCGGQMSFISFIEDPKAIDRIIGHLESLGRNVFRKRQHHHFSVEEIKGIKII